MSLLHKLLMALVTLALNTAVVCSIFYTFKKFTQENVLRDQIAWSSWIVFIITMCNDNNFKSPVKNIQYFISCVGVLAPGSYAVDVQIM